MEIRVGSPGFPPLATPSYPRTPPKHPSKQPPAKVLSSLRFPRNSLAKHAVRLCRMLSRVLSRLATSPFQSSFLVAPSSPFTSASPANCARQTYLRTTIPGDGASFVSTSIRRSSPPGISRSRRCTPRVGEKFRDHLNRSEVTILVMRHRFALLSDTRSDLTTAILYAEG